MRMKKRVLLASLVFVLPFTLTGCDRASWSDLNTPTRFLNKASKDYRYCYLALDDKDYKTGGPKDYNLEIKNALTEAGNFKKSEDTESNSERYFYYVNYYANSFIGVSDGRRCAMIVYDDGFIKIDYEDVKQHKYAYFTMDTEKASEINDLVRAKVARDQEGIQEDAEQAQEKCTPENFFKDAEKGLSIIVYEEDEKNYTTKSYKFKDNGEILNLAKNIEYTKTTGRRPDDSNTALAAYYYKPGTSQVIWSYHLYSTGDYLELEYHYENRFKERRSVEYSYNLDAEKGKEIIAQAIAKAK